MNFKYLYDSVEKETGIISQTCPNVSNEETNKEIYIGEKNTCDQFC